MSDLPVLVEWGNVISKLVVGGLAGLALLGYRSLRNRADVKPAREDANRMGLSIDEPREGPIAVRGTYRISEGEPWLDCSGERVALVGDILVVRGSSATWKGSSRTYALHDGDAVIAIGGSRARASAEATGYREAGGGWQLRSSSGEPMIQVCIATPVPCPRPLWPIRGLLVLGIVGATAYFGLGVVGKKLVASRNSASGLFLEGDGASTIAAQIACALPRSRDAGLTRFAIDLEYEPRTNDNLAQRIAIERLLNYRSAVILLQELGRYEQAVDVANDSGHPEFGREALVLLGRYDEAAQIEPLEGLLADDPLVGLIGAGRWREAAAHVEKRERTHDVDPSVVGNEQCLAGYFEALAGDPPKSGGTGSVCRIVDYKFDNPEDEYDSQVQIARWAVRGETRGFVDIDEIAMWFAPHVESDDFMTHALRAQLALDLGQSDLAVIEVEKALAVQEPVADEETQQFRTRRRRELAHELALRTGKPIEPFELPPDRERTRIEAAAALRSGAKADQVATLGYSSWEYLVPPMEAAASGDGLPLARAFESVNPLSQLEIGTEYLLAVAPKITSHREELVRAIQNREVHARSITYAVHQLALERDLLRMLGDKAGADRLQSIIDRHAKVFSDSQKLMALLLLQVP